MNEQNVSEQTATGAVTPPPFHANEAPVESTQEPTTSPTLADRIKALGLDEDTTSQLTRLTEGLDGNAAPSDDLLKTLARGITHDTDVENADAEGYLRGRNEKIEAVLPPEREPADDTEAVPVFPRYCRRSIWD